MSAVAVLGAIISSHALSDLIGSAGYAAVGLLVMCESFGIPLPGETMLITAALYAGTTHKLSVWLVWLVAAAAAVVGDTIGYWVGRKGGLRLLLRHGHKVRVNQAKLKVGRLLFDRYGSRVVFFGRFISVLRTYAAFLAGVNEMHYPRFLAANAAGGILWSGIFSVGFYHLGSSVRKARGSLDLVLIGVAAVAVVAGVLWIRRNEKRLEEEAERAYPGELTAD